ncbi:gamma-butyrobetaine dioxygenase [Fistulifera solaris]|uniref:Gamma-butyrobetaine dioxygenase n=1 Tax=Fistulifera solaris TaxID=1519565 RepID=A0A1Z5KDD9_FISSO|nr:gamma-butyrobetaine dioxygenase [Fistulifera solaris]|eukprot:GAX24206.1 gamma-butyrobetaine dioxygenase [Fistulifera solaris]
MKVTRFLGRLRRTIAPQQRCACFSNAATTPPSVSIAPDGLSLHLSFPSSSLLKKTKARRPAVIAAPWLFHQHPSTIHPSSGQHLRPLVHAHQYKLRHAQIIQRRHDAHPLLPPLGCFHSVGSVYSNQTDTPTRDSDCSSNISSSEWILQVDWEGPQPLQTAFYDIGWLRQCHSMNLHDNDDSNFLASKTVLTHQTQLLSVDYEEVIQHDDNLFHLLKSLLKYGAVLVENAPDTDTACANMGKRLSGGTLSHGSLYGDVFHVQSIPNAHNIAYTNDALPVHQDLAYYESPPGFQLLHCRTNTVTDGGASLLIDAMAAAETLANLAPDLFTILTRVPATFLKQRSGADMMYRRTHIRVSEQDHTEILSVHWAPPFEGPLFSSSVQDTRDYFVARAAFERMLDALLPRQERYLSMLDMQLEQELIDYAQNYTWQQTLRPKQILVFSNQRLLHGRTAFRIDTAHGGNRHLTGCYTNVDETLQQFRLLRRQRLRDAQDLETLPMMGHGSHPIP